MWSELKGEISEDRSNSHSVNYKIIIGRNKFSTMKYSKEDYKLTNQRNLLRSMYKI